MRGFHDCPSISVEIFLCDHVPGDSRRANSPALFLVLGSEKSSVLFYQSGGATVLSWCRCEWLSGMFVVWPNWQMRAARKTVCEEMKALVAYHCGCIICVPWSGTIEGGSGANKKQHTV